MKKIFSLTILLVMVFAAFVFLPAHAEETSTDRVFKISEDGLTATLKSVTLEKIPSPDQIRYFKVIKKEGGALWGIRLQKEGGNAIIKNTDDSVKQNIKDQLEKILAPQYVNLYNRITKIGDSLWGIPKKATSTPARLVTADMVTCVSNAIDKKDTAVKAAVNVSATDLAAAITVRGECQKKAIAVIENQIENLNVCIKNFQITNKGIVTKAHTSQQEAWKAYQTELKACSVTASTTASTTGVIMIEDGGAGALGTVIAQ